MAESGFTTNTLVYDSAGRVRAINSPGGASEVRSYASTGFLNARTVTASSGTVLGDTLTYDLRGLMMSARTAYRRGQASALTAQMAYTGLGALAIAANDALSDGQAENFKVDAIGNRLRIARPGFKPAFDSDFLGVRFMTYDQYARLTQVVDSVTAAPDNYELTETYQYDNAGTQNLQYTKEWNASNGTVHDATKSYPSIDDKLSVVNRQIGISAISDESHAGRHAVYQENWYDALGRRVLVRAQKSSVCNSSTFGELACKSFIERTVWDGDQVVLERRADGASGLTSGQLDQETSTGEDWGEVISLHALGLDAPIAVRKTGRTTLMPHENWQGDYEIGTTADGTATSLCSGTTTCPVIQWPGSVENADGLNTDNSVVSTWWGSLITEKLDASGLKYMRNRYYNPQTGQFTQQDPIGLAGGLNLYGFATGDPVNFSDPLGLCPWHDVACWDDQMWAASSGTGITGRVLAPLASTLLEGSGLSGVDRQAKAAAESGSAGDISLLVAQIGIAALPGGGEVNALKSAASERLLGEAIAGIGTRKAIAGAGTRKAIGDINRLLAEYGGKVDQWAKMVGGSYKAADGTIVQIHWYENLLTGLRTEFKQNIR